MAHAATRRGRDAGGRLVGDRGAGHSLARADGDRGRAVADAAAEHAGSGPVRIVCGKGNNGGDGLVAARKLAERGYEIEVLFLWPADELSPDSTANLERLESPWRVVDAGGFDAALGGLRPSSSTRSSARASPARPGPPRTRRSRRSTPPAVPAPPSSPATSPPGSTRADRRAEGGAVEADVTVTFHAAEDGQRINPGAGAHRRAARRRDRNPGRSARRAGRRRDRSADPRAAAAARRPLEQVQLRQRARRRRLARADRSRLPRLAGRDPGGGRIRGRCGPGVTRADPRGEAHRGDDDRASPSRTAGSRPPPPTRSCGRPESAACVVLGPGLGRAEGTQELIRSLADRIEQPTPDRRRRPQRLGTDLGLAAVGAGR